MKIEGNILKQPPFHYNYSYALGENDKIWQAAMLAVMQDTQAHKQISAMHEAEKQCAIVMEYDRNGAQLLRQVCCADEVRRAMYFQPVNEVLNTYRSQEGYAVIVIQAGKVSAATVGSFS